MSRPFNEETPYTNRDAAVRAFFWERRWPVLTGVALEENDPPVTVIIGCEADLKWQTNVVVDTDLVRIDFTSKDPAAQAIAAGMVAGVVTTDLDIAMGRERIDC